MTQHLTTDAVPEIAGFATVQKCLDSAPTESRERMIQFSFRAPPDTLERAAKICEAQGKSLAGFLRACCDNLVHEWGSCDSLES